MIVQIVMKVDTLHMIAPSDQTLLVATALLMMVLLHCAYGAKKCTGAIHADRKEYV